MMKTARSSWFEAVGPVRQNALQLFCFPYAGGGAQIFRPWQRYFSPKVALWLAHLPGRAARIGEPPFRDLKELVTALADAIAPVILENYVFCGHSMGALISFELARELRRRNHSLPGALFVSGRTAPQIPDPDPPTYNLPEKEFIAELNRLNGTPRELLENPETLSLFLPTIRADFQLVHTYAYRHEPPLACAIYAYGGLQDKDVPAESLNGWQKQTSEKFKVRMLPGDHFFIHTSLISVLRRDVEEFLIANGAHAR